MRDDRSLKSTRVRISTVTAAGFVVACTSATYLDANFTTHVIWGRARFYPLGYYTLLFTPLFFMVTYAALKVPPTRGNSQEGNNRWLLAWLPSALLAIPFY
jgi:hypothetical protein